MKKEYSFTAFNEFLNIEASPVEIKDRLYEIAINYAKGCDESYFSEMKKDISFLQWVADHVAMIIEKTRKEEIL